MCDLIRCLGTFLGKGTLRTSKVVRMGLARWGQQSITNRWGPLDKTGALTES